MACIRRRRECGSSPPFSALTGFTDEARSAGDSPKKSFHCPTNMMTPIPAVKPAMTGFGMYLMTAPRRAKPNASNIIPAISVAICSPAIPCCAVMIASTATNAPVGPEICTSVPPKREVISAATMAVYSPCSGRAPLAIANAIASGSATTPTTMPARTLLRIWASVHKPSAFARRRAIMSEHERYGFGELAA